MGIDSTATSINSKEELNKLRDKYEASKETLAEAKNANDKYSNIYAEAKAKYGATNPDKVEQAKNNFKSTNSIYTSADSNNDFLNGIYFNAILDAGKFNFNT